MGEIYLSDNKGHRVPPHPDMADPVVGSGQTLTYGTKDTNRGVSVTPGAYAFTAQEVGGFYLGLVSVTADAANIIWACPVGKTIIINIPEGYISLKYSCDTNDAIGYLRRLSTP